jgi:hypothetical protein
MTVESDLEWFIVGPGHWSYLNRLSWGLLKVNFFPFHIGLF